jgi:cell division GTPase FtsZ
VEVFILDIKVDNFYASPKGMSISKPNELDAELEALIAKQKTAIKVVGCGGAGKQYHQQDH